MIREKSMLRLWIITMLLSLLVFALPTVAHAGVTVAIFDGSNQATSKSVNYSSTHSFTLKCKAAGNSGGWTDVTNDSSSVWKSSNTNVATVSKGSNATVTIKGPGTANITCTYTYGEQGVQGYGDYTATLKLTVTGSIAYLTALNPSKTTAYVGDSVTWTPTLAGGYGSKQVIYRLYKGSTSSSVVNQVTKSGTTPYSYTLNSTGDWYVQGQAVDGNNQYSSRFTAPKVTVYNLPSVSSVTASESKSYVGWNVTFSATATGGASTAYTYNYKLFKNGTQYDSWSTQNDYTVYTFPSAGTWYVKVSASDGTKTSSEVQSPSVVVSNTVSVSSVTPSTTSCYVEESITFTASASGGAAALEYTFEVYKDNSSIYASFPSSTNTCTYTPYETGTYYAKVQVSDGTVTQTAQSSSVTVKGLPVTFTKQPDDINADLGADFYYSVEATNGLYYYWQVSDDGGTTWQYVQGQSDRNLYVPAVPCNFGKLYRCEAKSKTGDTAMSRAAALTNSGNVAEGVLVLPDDVKVVDVEAFQGAGMMRVIIPDGCTTIGDGAFANCPSLEWIYIPASVGSISSTAFSNSPNVRIYTTKGSYAEYFASVNGITETSY